MAGLYPFEGRGQDNVNSLSGSLPLCATASAADAVRVASDGGNLMGRQSEYPTISAVLNERDLANCRLLFLQYFKWLEGTFKVSLEFQDVDGELATLPGAYVGPGGALYLAHDRRGAAVGCIAFRRLSADTCELKRLYVVPQARGTGLGKRLAEHALFAAGGRGYRRVVLDTLAAMTGARRLYAALGFVDIAPYYDNPLADACYMGRDLAVRFDPDQSANTQPV